MQITQRKASVAAAKTLLWLLSDQYWDQTIEAELRNVLRAYIKRYEND